MGRNAKAGVTVAVLTGTGSRESLAAASDYCLNDITELGGAAARSSARLTDQRLAFS